MRGLIRCKLGYDGIGYGVAMNIERELFSSFSAEWRLLTKLEPKELRQTYQVFVLDVQSIMQSNPFWFATNDLRWLFSNLKVVKTPGRSNTDSTAEKLPRYSPSTSRTYATSKSGFLWSSRFIYR